MLIRLPDNGTGWWRSQAGPCQPQGLQVRVRVETLRSLRARGFSLVLPGRGSRAPCRSNL